MNIWEALDTGLSPLGSFFVNFEPFCGNPKYSREEARVSTRLQGERKTIPE
jgi:hypothetical protein